MLRLVMALRRKPGLSPGEFQDYWLNIHGPLCAGYSTVLGISHCRQTHTLDDPINQGLRQSRGSLEPYDGLFEFWWDDTEAFNKTKTPEGQAALRHLADDEKNFVDSSRSSAWIAADVPQVNPTPENITAGPANSIVKLVYLLRRLPGLPRDAAQAYWRDNHGPLIRKHAQAARVLRYIQVHALDDTRSEPFRQVFSRQEEPYDGHAELWYDRADMAAAAASPEGRLSHQLFHEDEKKFIDFSRSALWIAKEHIIIDRY